MPQRPGNKRVLLVDDSGTVIALEKLLLRDEPLELTTAHNGRQALEVALERVPDLILLDVVMPELDGIECCRRLRAEPLTAHVPVIMVTTKGNQAMVDAAFEAGCNDYVTKPIDKVQLLQKVRRLLAPGVTASEPVLHD
jgi:PleD family two-component response regulator